ncbi:hypothetical protein CBM2592_A70209 [Cupriavidus taiwanensis]|nr:hypothetical protein CBM2592_A70209 [Cupriavidus taiwanensis]
MPDGRGGREDGEGEGLGWPWSGLDMSAILGTVRAAHRRVLLASDDAAVCRIAIGAGRPGGAARKRRRRAGACRAARTGRR